MPGAVETSIPHLALVAKALADERRPVGHDVDRRTRLADDEVAEIIERLAAVPPGHRPVEHTLRAYRHNERLRTARTCYGHLAGRLGVQLRDGLLRSGVVSNVNGYALTPDGARWFDDLGYPVRSRGQAKRRAMVRPCLDWTERVDHLAGIAADTFCHALTDLGWIVRSDKDRAVQVSSSGNRELVRLGLLERDVIQ